MSIIDTNGSTLGQNPAKLSLTLDESKTQPSLIHSKLSDNTIAVFV